MRDVVSQLRGVFERSGMSVRTLLEKSGLDIDRSSLQRKLHGQQPLRVAEAEALASVLGVRIGVGKEARA
jgi:transcriptional regulator with XRE-family HTH domain